MKHDDEPVEKLWGNEELQRKVMSTKEIAVPSGLRERILSSHKRPASPLTPAVVSLFVITVVGYSVFTFVPSGVVPRGESFVVEDELHELSLELVEDFEFDFNFDEAI